MSHGPANPCRNSLTYTVTGSYRSADGGPSWTNIGPRDSGAVGKLVIDPRNPHHIFVAATGSTARDHPQYVTPVSAGTQDNGLACFHYGNCFRSADAGDTTVFFGDSTASDRRNWFTPVQSDANDPNVTYPGSNRSTPNDATRTPISPT